MRKSILIAIVLITVGNSFSFDNIVYINVLKAYRGGFSIGYQHSIVNRNALGLFLDFQASNSGLDIYGAYLDYNFYAKSDFKGFWSSVKIGSESYFKDTQVSLIPGIGYNWVIPMGLSFGFNLGCGPAIRLPESEWKIRFLGDGHIGYCF